MMNSNNFFYFIFLNAMLILCTINFGEKSLLFLLLFDNNNKEVSKYCLQKFNYK